MTAAVDSLYPAHLKDVRRRTDAALKSAGFDRVAVFSGRLTYRFPGDAPYPFKVNPHFKWWVPVVDNPATETNENAASATIPFGAVASPA